jgi:hypothetical protein
MARHLAQNVNMSCEFLPSFSF